MSVLVQFAIGVLFGLGLVIAGMSNPAKVLNFLDFGASATGGWDPSLAATLAGAVIVTFAGFRQLLRQDRPVFADRFHWPATTPVDSRILVGPAIFGIGWGLAGFCPGTALTALVTGQVGIFIFVGAMFAGMAAARWLGARLKR